MKLKCLLVLADCDVDGILKELIDFWMNDRAALLVRKSWCD